MDNLSEEEKKAIENFKSFIKQKEKEQETLYLNEEFYRDDIEQNELFLKMLHSILNLIKKKSEVIQRMQELLDKSDAKNVELYKEIEIKDKMIDSMVNEVLALDKIRARYEQDRPRIWETEEGIKEYFRKKVKKE